MSKFTELKSEAKSLGIKVGRLTTNRRVNDYCLTYDVYEDGLEVSSMVFADTASEAKEGYIELLIEEKQRELAQQEVYKEKEAQNKEELVKEWLKNNPQIGTLNSGKFYMYDEDGEYKEIEALA